MMRYSVDPIGELSFDENSQLGEINGRFGKVAANSGFVVRVEKYG